MASTGNHNNQGGTGTGTGTPFDLQALFKPETMAAQNPSNFGTPAFPPSPYTLPSPSSSYPPPSGTFPNPPPQNLSPLFQHTPTAPPINPNPGARLMALLGAPPTNQSNDSSPPIQPPNVPISHSVHPLNAVNAAICQQAPLRLPSRKVPRGRHLAGERVVYDVAVRFQGEVQPQLEVNPITKYVSDPELILGCQVAVNKTYICYGLKAGNVRVLNINTALRSLLKGHTQRVTDMAFFAEDVHLLASASIDGRLYVWKISEGADEEGKQQISGNVVVAIRIVGEEGSVHPRVCWHCHKQEILVLAIGRNVLRIDMTKVGNGEAFTAEEPLECSLDKLVNGIQLVGKHDAEVTDLSMCQWMKTRLVSASKDGTIRIWEDGKSQPLLVLKPHDGLPVDAAIFLTAPDRPAHIILITAGPRNREVKLWISSSEAGWLLPSGSESWKCIQTLELYSSAERAEDAFFNQVVGLSQEGLLLLANARKNAIYAVNLEYGSNPASTHMNYLAEFTVTMPILSFTGISDVLPHGDHVVKVYCVQTHAIQQYDLDLSECSPPPMESFGLEKSDSSVSRDVTGFHESSPEIKRALGSASYTANLVETPTSKPDSNTIASLVVTTLVDVPAESSSLPLSPKLLRKPSDFLADPAVTDYSVVRHIDNAKMDLNSLPSTQSDSMVAPAEANPSVMFKHPPPPITPLDFFRATSSSYSTCLAESKSKVEARIQGVGVTGDARYTELEIEDVGEASFFQESNFSTQVEPQIHTDRTGNFSRSQASEIGVEMSRESGLASSPELPHTSALELNDTSAASTAPSTEAHFVQLVSTQQEMLDQILSAQKEMQKQMSIMFADPVNKECKRLEVALGRCVEKAGKANSDALWARIQEEIAKLDKLVREHTQQMTSLVVNCFNKGLMPALDKTLKKEMAAVATNVARTVTPVIEKTISSAISDTFQKVVGDKAINQLEKSVNSRVEAVIARQMQVQFQTSGKQALQEGLKSVLEATIIPAFELSCKALNKQINASFENGMLEHTTAAQHQIESAQSPLAITLSETLNSASSITQTLHAELAEQRKFAAFAAAGANSEPLPPLLIKGPLAGLPVKVEQPYDPTKELSRLISELKYEEAFAIALQRSDVSIVSWLCSQADLQRLLLSTTPLPLSQGVLLSLLQQLACDINNETAKKLSWITEVAAAINPEDPTISIHVRPIFEQVYQILNHRVSLPTSSASESRSIRLIMHVINSMLMTCK